MNDKALKLVALLAVIAAAVAAGLAGSAAGKAEGGAAATAASASGQKTLTVDDIINRSNYVAYYQGKDGRAKIKMTVVDKQGQKRQKELIILRRDQPAPGAKDAGKAADAAKAKAAADAADMAYCREQKFYVYFQSPPDDNKTTFLVWKKLDADDDRWLYLPNLDLVKRIAATDKRTSFVGSHFYYEDVSGRNLSADKHELLKTTDQYYVLRNTPKDPKTVEFAYYDMYVLKDSFVPVYVWYYDKGGKKYRTYSVLKWDRDKTFGYAVVRAARMADANIGGHTDLQYDDVRFNMALPESLFTERYLKRTPYRFLK